MQQHKLNCCRVNNKDIAKAADKAQRFLGRDRRLEFAGLGLVSALRLGGIQKAQERIDLFWQQQPLLRRLL